MDFLAEWLRTINVWWVLALAILLIFIDLALLQTEAFLTLGISLVPISMMLGIGIDTRYIVWMIPLCLIAAFFGQRRLFLLTGSNSPKPSFETSQESHIGQHGTLLIINSRDTGKSFYYEPNETLIDPGQDAPETTLFRVELADGTRHPAEPVDGNPRNDGARVRITGVRNGAFVVELLEEK